jgi:vancomycin permeability regulator SanA
MGSTAFYWRCFVAIVLGYAVIASTWITSEGLTDTAAKSDLVIIPGNTVNPDGSLSPRLKGRLDAALSLWHDGLVSYFFVSGGVGKEGVDEAQAMKAYLVASGVPALRIFQDSEGLNTEATARNAAEWMRKNKLTSAVIATQFFHITRLRILLKQQGVNVVGNVHGPYFELRDAYSLAREVVALSVILLKNLDGIAND